MLRFCMKHIGISRKVIKEYNKILKFQYLCERAKRIRGFEARIKDVALDER